MKRCPKCGNRMDEDICSICGYDELDGVII